MTEDLKHKYAVVVTAKGMLEGCNAVLNGLEYYNNEIDLYVVGSLEDKKVWLEEIEKNKKRLNIGFKFIPFKEAQKKWPIDKSGGWQARFLRYKCAQSIADQYKAILIIDADMLVLNNLMKYFKLAEKSDFLILPTNPWGMDVEKVLEIGTEPLRGASSPPFHNMPLFFNPKTWKWFLDKVWRRGAKEGFGDMVTVSKTIFIEKLLDRVFALPNCFWVLSTFYANKIDKKQYDKKHYLVHSEHRINSVHRRWWHTDTCEKFVREIKESDNYERGSNNVPLFWEEYRFFNKDYKIRIPFSWNKPKIK